MAPRNAPRPPAHKPPPPPLAASFGAVIAFIIGLAVIDGYYFPIG